MRTSRAEWIWLLLFVLNVATIYWWVTRDIPEREPAAVASADQQPSAPPPPQHPRTALYKQQGCWLPEFRMAPATNAEAPDRSAWRGAGASGDQLAEDPCGNVWALWFNSWSVFSGASPGKVGRLSLPRDGLIAELARSGVSAFLPLTDGFWIVGRNGEVSRFSDQGWHRELQLGQRCEPAQLLAFGDELWLNCLTSQAPRLLHRPGGDADWKTPANAPSGPRFLLRSRDGRLLALGLGEIAELESTAHGWKSRPAPLPLPTRELRADADAQGVTVAAGSQIIVVGAQGEARTLDLSDGQISGLLRLDPERLLVSVRGEGLNYFDDQDWHRWRFAHGLPGSDARDLLIDSASRLWLAGRPVITIDAESAFAAITRLSNPLALEGTVYADACAAASALLGRALHDGQVAQERLDGQQRVFFSGTQVCPDPWRQDLEPLFFRRQADGALLQVPYNAHNRRTRCSKQCLERELAELTRQWTFTLYLPEGPGAKAPMTPRLLPPPTPLPLQSPGPEGLLTTSGDVWIASADGVFQHDGAGWQRHDIGSVRAVNQLVEDDYGGVWLGLSVPSQSGTSPLQRWSGRQWDPVALTNVSQISLLAAFPGGVLAGGFNRLLQVDTSGHVEQALGKLPSRSGGAHISVDVARMLWLSRVPGEHGLIVLEGGRSGRVSTREGLLIDQVRATAHDQQGRVWIWYRDGRVGVYSRFELIKRARWYSPSLIDR